MQPHDFKRIRTGLGLSHHELAIVIGKDVRQVFRYEGGDSPINPTARNLLICLEAAPQLVELLRAHPDQGS